MQSLFSRALVLIAGLLIGILGVTGVLVLLQDHGSSSDSQQIGERPRSDTVGSTISMDSITSDSVPSDLNDLVFPRLAFDRTASILSWVNVLSEDQILNWLEQSIEPSWDVPEAHRHELQSVLLQKLSTTSPEKAFEFAWSRDDHLHERGIFVFAAHELPWLGGFGDDILREGMASITLLAWANSDLDGAITHIKQMDAGVAAYYLPVVLQAREDLNLDQQREIAKELGDESYAFFNYFQNLTRGSLENPKETWYEIVNLANQEGMQKITGDALSRVAVAWVENEGKTVFDEIVSSISQDSKYGRALSNVFSALSTDEPEEIFDYILKNLGDRAYEVIQGSDIAYNWAHNDPRGLLSKAETLPASRLRQRLIDSAAREWANHNPQQLLANLELLPQENQEYASRTAIRTLTRKSPPDAAKFVLQVEDYESQLELATTLVRQWSYQDSDAAKDWVFNIPESNALRSALIRPLANILVNTDPRAAFQLALEQPINEQGSSSVPARGFESSILSRIASRDLDLALELLPQVRDIGSSKVQVYTDIGSTLIENGEIQQALSLSSHLSEEQQVPFYQGVTSIWAVQDPKGFLNAFEEFPNEEIKSSVALSVKFVNNMTNTFSAEEIAIIEKYISKEDKEKLEQIKDIDLFNATEEEQQKLEELFPGQW
ncbi:MAG: hypothetical protein F4X56_02115 [Gammaproteobacteria bacterium]|nr:hypothetical protein [Gammaproteobacteria bacterium]MYC24699.1 hypothetical protein [Gammaproteobacteria bacterium]